MNEETYIIPEYLKNLITHVSPGAYWSVLKKILNNNNTLIIPTFLYENRLHRTNHLISTKFHNF